MLKIENLIYEGKSLDKKVNIINNIAFKISEGEKICLIGPSGAGKTTFLRILSGLEVATSGKIILDEKTLDIKKNNRTFLCEKIGMIFQHYNLFNHLKVIDNITLALIHVKKKKKSQAEKIALEYLNKMDLSDKSNSFPHELSGGQKQRVAIIRALVMEPELLLVDEPTSALDPKTSINVAKLFKNILTSKMSMICVTHDMNFVRQFPERVLYMQNGEIKYDGQLNDEVLNNFDFG